jgi:DNA (cytosine-5)-methyltransferase 1
MDKVKVLSLFSGCGGMDLGFEGNFSVHQNAINLEIHPDWQAERVNDSWVKLPRTKFEIVFANDILREAMASYMPFFTNRGSTHQFNNKSIVDLVKGSEIGDFTFPEADIVIGGFPCQDFSVAGKRLGLKSHKSHKGIVEIDAPTTENRGLLYTWMKRVIEIVKPKVFIAENVKGLVSLGDVKKIIENDFRNIDEGYLVLNAKVLHAGQYGVPQTRERVIFIGFNKKYLTQKTITDLELGLIDPYPPKTHYLPSEQKNGLKKWVTVYDVLKDLPEPEFSQDPSQQAISKAKYYGSHVQGQKEVDLDGLGPTIRAEHHGNIEFRRLSKKHGGKNTNELGANLIERRLTVRECARIQTFPDDFQFVRLSKDEINLSPSNGYKVIGNAVPPLLGFNIAWQLQKIWVKLFKE